LQTYLIAKLLKIATEANEQVLFTVFVQGISTQIVEWLSLEQDVVSCPQSKMDNSHNGFVVTSPRSQTPKATGNSEYPGTEQRQERLGQDHYVVTIGDPDQ
jgi:hypothetical protein